MKERRKRHGTGSSRCDATRMKESLMRRESLVKHGERKGSWRRVAARDVLPQAETRFSVSPTASCSPPINPCPTCN